MTELKFQCGPMALIENERGGTWIVYAKIGDVSYKLFLDVGQNQMEAIERGGKLAAASA